MSKINRPKLFKKLERYFKLKSEIFIYSFLLTSTITLSAYHSNQNTKVVLNDTVLITSASNSTSPNVIFPTTLLRKDGENVLTLIDFAAGKKSNDIIF